jgi:hypothetical protein
MDFSHALVVVKEGKRIRREGWNAWNQFVYYVPAASYPATTDVARQEFGTDRSSETAGQEVMVPYRAYLAFKTVNDEVVPWVASQSDLLADDWVVTT